MVKALPLEPSTLTAPLPSAKHTPKEEPRLSPVELARENRRHDLILAGLALLFVFLLTSFPVLNGDIWLQLRTGQMIVNGEFGFGADPFTYTEHGLWVHTAWLWDTLLYSVYAVAEGPGLALLRGLLMLGLAVVLFQIRRPDVSLLPVVLSLALAFVAMSARLFLRSEVITLVFIGLTLYLLWRPAARPRIALGGKLLGVTQNHLWVLLPVVFALWANCDYWFFLGPCMVLLYLVGEYVQGITAAPGRGKPDREETRSLVLVLVVGTLACLLNPYTVRVFFQLPPDLGSEALELVMLNQPTLRLGPLRGLVSPFSGEFFAVQRREELQGVWWRPYGLTLAEWSYYLLALVSGASFVFNWKGLRLWRLLLWIGFFILSAWQAQKIAFFAVVAGPIMALNFQDWMAARATARDSVALPWVITGQLARITGLILILSLCYVTTVRMEEKSLQQRGRETALGLIHTRALGWSMPVDPSLRRSAEQLDKWQLPGHGLSLDWREQPAYLAFFAPGAQSFMDNRLQLHQKAAKDFFLMEKNLKEVNPFRPDKKPTHQHFQWQDAFRKHDISYLMVSANTFVDRPDRQRERLVERLMADEIETRDASNRPVRTKVWELLDYVDGRTFVLAWTGSEHYSKLKALRFDPEREAFRAPLRPAPAHGFERITPPSPLATWLAGELNRPPLALDESAWLRATSQMTYERARIQAIGAGFMPLAMMPAQATPGTAIYLPPLLGVEMLTLAENQLAIRAARRAIAERPDYADGYNQLYQAYFDVARIERELGMPRVLRDTQMLVALREAVQLRPQEPLLQLELAQVYLSRNLGDLAVTHYEKFLLAAEAMGVEKERLTSTEMHSQFTRVSQTAANRLASFRARAALIDDPGERARFAMELGLKDEARQAMETVMRKLNVQPDLATGNLAIRQLLDLYLEMGNADGMLFLLSRPDAPGRLGPAVYHQRSALALAARGDYQGSIQHWQQYEQALGRQAIEHAILGVGLHTRGFKSEMPGSLMHGIIQLEEGQQLNASCAEALLQAGLLALEAGWTQPSPDHADAPALFKKALTEVHPGSSHRALAVRYYRLMTGKWLDE